MLLILEHIKGGKYPKNTVTTESVIHRIYFDVIFSVVAVPPGQNECWNLTLNTHLHANIKFDFDVSVRTCMMSTATSKSNSMYCTFSGNCPRSKYLVLFLALSDFIAHKAKLIDIYILPLSKKGPGPGVQTACPKITNEELCWPWKFGNNLTTGLKVISLCSSHRRTERHILNTPGPPRRIFS